MVISIFRGSKGRRERAMIDTRQNNHFSHQTALFTVGRVFRRVYGFLELRIKKQLYCLINS